MRTLLMSRSRMRAGITMAGFLALAGVLGFAFNRTVFAESTGKASAISSAELAAKTTGLSEMENGFTAIADKMRPSIVMIEVQKTVSTGSDMPDISDLFRGFPGSPNLRSAPRTFKQKGAGSGVIIRSDGWIITNDHVVNGADKVTVKLSDGRTFTGTVRRDYRSDLALVKVDANNLVAAELGDSDKVRVGQWAIAFGSPFELTDTMTHGIVSALHRQTAIGDGTDARFYPSLIQTDAPINPGNSGGPLVDIRGRIIGINVAINSPSGGSVGIGFAIPANTARNIMDQLITKGKVTRGFLGVVPRSLTPDERNRYGVKQGGALIEQVSEDTPAAKAGLQVEDVVLKIDGKQVDDDISFRSLIANLPPNSKVAITIWRARAEKTVNVVLGTVPDEANGGPKPIADAGGKLGLKVQDVTPDTIKKYNLQKVTAGVMVTEVQSGGPADEAGLQPGDVITRANQKPIAKQADLASVVNALKSGEAVSLVVQRGDTRSLVTVTAP